MAGDLALGAASEEIELLERVGTQGPYEEWLARPRDLARLPRILAVRRPHPARPDTVELSVRLTSGASRTKRVEHHLIRHCFGVLEHERGALQLLEDLEGVSLERLLEAGGPVPAAAAVALTARAAEAIAHAHSLDVAHGALSPSQIIVLRGGRTRLDFTLSPAFRPGSLTEWIDPRYGDPRSTGAMRADLQALAAILRETLTGSIEGSIATIPPGLKGIVERASSATPNAFAPRSLADALLRVLYRELGDPERAEAILAERVETALPRALDPRRRHEETEETRAEAASGRFARALLEREAPVHPRDLTTGDYGAESPLTPLARDPNATDPDGAS